MNEGSSRHSEGASGDRGIRLSRGCPREGRRKQTVMNGGSPVRMKTMFASDVQADPSGMTYWQVVAFCETFPRRRLDFQERSLTPMRAVGLRMTSVPIATPCHWERFMNYPDQGRPPCCRAFHMDGYILRNRSRKRSITLLRSVTISAPVERPGFSGTLFPFAVMLVRLSAIRTL